MELYGIIGAMDCEIELICKSLDSVSTKTINSFCFYLGKINNNQVVVVKSGVGKVNAALCVAILVDVFHVTKIINSGIAGAISNDLHVFDFVVSTEAFYHDVDVTAFGYVPCTLPGMPTFFPASTSLIEKVVKAFESLNLINHKIFKGRIASGDQFISSIDKKSKIKNLNNPYCVEMEGAAVAHACYIYQIPFVTLRCISDLADKPTDEFNEAKAGELSASIILRLLS